VNPFRVKRSGTGESGLPTKGEKRRDGIGTQVNEGVLTSYILITKKYEKASIPIRRSGTGKGAHRASVFGVTEILILQYNTESSPSIPKREGWEGKLRKSQGGTLLRQARV